MLEIAVDGISSKEPQVKRNTHPITPEKLQRFEDACKEHRKYIYNFLQKQFRFNHHEAEDIIQKTYIRSWNNLDTFREECSYKTLFYRSALRAGSNYYNSLLAKKRNRRKTFSLDEEVENDNGDTFNRYEQIVSPDECPLSTIEKKELKRKIKRGIAELSYDHKVIMHLMINGHSYEEIALKLKIAVGTVKSRIARARGNLGVQVFNKGKSHDNGRYTPRTYPINSFLLDMPANAA